MRIVPACLSLLIVGNLCVAPVDVRQSTGSPIAEIYELYCWQTSQAVWQFVLLPNTSRDKTVDEVFDNPDVMTGVDAFRRRLETLEAGASVLIVAELPAPDRLGPASGSERLRIPPERMLDDLRKTARRRRVTIDAGQPTRTVYELYCWRLAHGAWEFLLLPRVPREKTADDIFKNPNAVAGIDALERNIQLLEMGAEVVVVTTLNSPSLRGPGSEQLLALPKPMLDELRKSVSTRKIQIRPVRSVDARRH